MKSRAKQEFYLREKLTNELVDGSSRLLSLMERTQSEPPIHRFLKTTMLTKAGHEHWVEMMNLYVALKSKPMAILHGPANGGKDDAMRLIGQALTGGDSLRFQHMMAHARWANNNNNVALFTEAQTRLNANKLLALIEEALQPENAHLVYVAHLHGLTPAELIGFFSDLTPQIAAGRLANLSCLELSAPLPYPSNLLLTGTMDRAPFNWCEPDQIAHAVVIPWFSEPTASDGWHSTIDQTGIGRHFLASRVRTRRAACRKLLRLKVSGSRAMHVLYQLEQVLETNKVSLPSRVADDILIYLSNAWSDDGIGLFDRDSERNLWMALDLAVSQSMLPYILAELPAQPSLSRQLVRTLQPELPQSAAWLTNPC